MAKRTVKTRRKRKQNRLVRFLASVPTSVLWLIGIGIAASYVYFLFHIVLHFSLPWKARFGEVPEPDGYEVRGIDISHYQSSIHWDKLSEAELNHQPIRFVIMKATEGSNIFDKTFNSNFHQAKVNGFVRGAYHFFIPGTNARQQAEYFLSQVHLVPGDLPPVLDVEKDGGLSREQLRSEVREWLHIVGQYYGVKPIIYTNYSYKMQYLNTDEFNQYPFWIARYYKKELNYDGHWHFWQYTDCGTVQGIKGNVDCNVFNGSMSDLRAFCITSEQFPISL